jgi:hypothetical protein
VERVTPVTAITLVVVWVTLPQHQAAIMVVEIQTQSSLALLSIRAVLGQ